MRSRARTEAGRFGPLMVADGFGQGVGNAAVAEDGGRHLDVVGSETFALERLQRFAATPVGGDRRVFGWVGRGEDQRADLRQQTTGEQFVRRGNPRQSAQRVTGNRHQQRVGPERGVVERTVRAVEILVDEREAHGDLSHRAHAEAQYGFADRSDRPATGACRVAQTQQTARKGRVALDDLRHFVERRILPPADLEDGHRHALRARQPAADAKLFDLVHLFLRCRPVIKRSLTVLCPSRQARSDAASADHDRSRGRLSPG